MFDLVEDCLSASFEHWTRSCHQIVCSMIVFGNWWP